VIYYGAYANASTLQREHRRAWEGQGEASPWAPPAEEPTPFERRCRIRWAQLIFYSWRPGESLVTSSRSPPELLAVAESA